MAFVNPFRLPGRWFRGNTHTHTTVSDGRIPLPERVQAYREAGYDFLVLTDHRAVTDVSSYCDSDFLAIPGSELHPANPYGGDLYHLVALNIDSPIETEGMHPNEVIAAVHAQGGQVVIGHPYWCGHTLTDLLPLEGCFAVEVFNATCGWIGKEDSEPHWDALLDRKGQLFGIAADDCHAVKEDSFRGWVMVKSEALTRESIMDALVRGAYYSTTGPTISDLEVTPAADGGRKGTKVTVRCPGARRITFKAQHNFGSSIFAPKGELLESADYVLNGNEKFVRVEVIDPQGCKAWTNPIFF